MNNAPNTSNVEYQFSYHIIPFAFEETFNKELISLITSASITQYDGNSKKEVSIWRESEIGGKERLFAHVGNLISSDSDCKERIGRKFTVNESVRSESGIFPDPDTEMEYKNKVTNFRFFIDTIELFVFETQVGFLCFKYRYDNSFLPEDIINANYYLKNLNQNSQKLFTIRKIKLEDTETGINENVYEEQFSKFDLNKGIRQLIEMIKPKTYFEQTSSLPKQALVFSALCLKNKPEDVVLKNYLFKMRRLFKDSYKPAEIEFEFISNNEIIQAFENSYWGISMEGCANIFYLIDDENTNYFLKGPYKGNVENTYLFLYIIALHQKYALLNFSISASLLEAETIDKTEEELKEAIEHTKCLKSHIAAYYLRCNFLNVSNITHQAEIYDMMRRTLRVNESVNEINTELDSISDLLCEQEQQLRNEREKKETVKREENERIQLAKEKQQAMDRERLEKEALRKQSAFNAMVAVLSTMFVVLQTINSFWDMANKLRDNNVPKLWSKSFIFFLSFSTIVSLGCVIGMIYFITNWLKAERNCR